MKRKLKGTDDNRRMLNIPWTGHLKRWTQKRQLRIKVEKYSFDFWGTQRDKKA